MSKCGDNHTSCQCKSPLASQTLDELDFERGIWSAAQFGELGRIEELIRSQKYSVNSRDSAGYTALHYAARNGRLDVCKYLVENGAEINAVTKSGNATALHRSCSAGEIEIVQYLLQKNADLLIQDSDGKTALHRSVESKNRDITELLLRHKPELKNIADRKGLLPVIDLA